MLTRDKKGIIKSIKNCIQEYIRNYKELLSELDKILDRFDNFEKIKFLKNAEVLVDRRGVKKYNSIIKQILRLSYTPEYLKQYLDVVLIINKVFTETTRLQTKLNNIPPQKRLSSILVASQQMQSVAKEMRKPYGYDGIINAINDGLKSLIYDDKIFNGEEFIYGAKDHYTIGFFDNSLEIANQYIRNSIETADFEKEYEEWTFGYRSFTKRNQRIVSSVTDKEIEFFYKTGIKEDVIDFLFTIYYGISRGIQGLEQIESLEERYNYTKFLLQRKYFCNCLNIKIQNIPIYEWMSAYFVLKKYVKKLNYTYKYERVSFFNYGIRNKHSKTKEEWIETFIKYGVSKEYASALFELMVFNKKSVDLFDNPFVPCCGKYFVVPWIIEEMKIGKVLLSKFSDKEGTDFKGEAFENYILDVLKYCRIPAIRMKNKEYECDVAFLIDNVLFICECKNRGGDKAYDLSFDLMDDDIYQVDRIATFYKEHPDIVKRSFQKAGYRKISFNEVKKIVIYSKVTHGVVIKDETFVMDIYKFLQPLVRDEMTDYLARKYLLIKESLTGKLTAQKIISYYSCPVSYSDYPSALTWVYTDYKVGRYRIKTERVKLDDWAETIDKDFLFEYCMAKKAKILYVEEMYKRGKISKEFLPPELRNGQ